MEVRRASTEYANVFGVSDQLMTVATERSLNGDTPVITISDALVAMRKVRVTIEPETRTPVTTMIGTNQETFRNQAANKKRCIKDVKKTTVCFACGKAGHWLKDQKD